jgi:hypothetical protein
METSSMQTRSMLQKYQLEMPTYDWTALSRASDHLLPSLDFDAASRAWKSNKRSTGQGTYTYSVTGVRQKTT